MPDEPEVMGLLALMLLIESRRAARVAADGDLVLLAHQDRSRWNRALIHEGHVLVRHCLARNEPGPSQLQAAINAVHSCASSAADTDWQQIRWTTRPPWRANARYLLKKFPDIVEHRRQAYRLFNIDIDALLADRD